MTVTMSFLLNDRSLIVDTAREAFNRRKQLCPFELTLEEMIDVIYRPDIAIAIRFLRADRPTVLHWDNKANLIMPVVEGHPHGQLSVAIKTQTTFPLACDSRVMRDFHDGAPSYDVQCDGPLVARLKEWAWKATQVELENRWAMRIICELVNKSSTHQQIHRYMPEIYTLLASEQDARIAANAYTRRRLSEVYAELKAIGSVRATKLMLEGVTPRDRASLKALVAQCLILPVHDGLGDKTEFDETWINYPLKP